MTTEEVKVFVLERAKAIVGYCCDKQECDEERYSEIDICSEVDEQWNENINVIKNEVRTARIKVIYECLLQIAQALNDGVDFSSVENPCSAYHYEITDDEFDKFLLCGGQIHNTQGKYYAFVNLVKQNDLLTELLNQENGNLFLYLWVISVSPEIINQGKKYIITNYSPKNLNKEELISLIKMELSLIGKQYKEIHNYDNTFLKCSLDRGFDCFAGYSVEDVPYVQINSLCDVLSDYHSSGGVLDKYLRLYHVYEELMIRKMVVKFTKEPDLCFIKLSEYFGQKQGNEKTALIELLTCVMVGSDDKNVDATLLTEIIAIWNQANTEIHDYLDKWYIDNNITKDGKKPKDFATLTGGSNVNANDLSKYLGYVIYQVRCKIVHNKATESHWTNRTLDEKNEKVLKKILIPLMEMLCIRTLVKLPEYIRYDLDKLEIKLY